ncbi:MAG: DNA internalization-related competence protein ComEC/Rec2 [Inhella sp.]
MKAPAWQPGAALALLLGLLGGLAGLQFLPRLLLPAEQAGLLAAALGLGVWVGWSRPGRTPLLLMLGVLLGLSWAQQRASWRLADGLAPAHIGQPVWVEAEVDGLPQALAGYGGVGGWRLPLRLLERPGGVPEQVSVSWFPGAGREQAPRAGERWRLQLRLKPVHALQNPGLPDTELWLLERGVRAQGSVRAGERLAAASAWNLAAARERIRAAIQARVSEPRARAVLAGLAIGDQGGIAAGDWALLRDTGVVHLFAVSGLHITWFAWLAAAGVHALWRRSAWLCTRWPAPAAARWLGLAAALGYALLAGWGVPAQRTVGLLAVLVLLQSSARIWPWALALSLAGAVVGLADPWALVTPGFWLSFAAVALLMQAAPAEDEATAGWRRLPQLAWQGLRVQLLASAGLAPLTLIFFGQVSLVGLLTNLVAVPLVTSVLVPLALGGLLLAPLWQLGTWGVQALFAGLELAQRLPGAVWWAAQAPWFIEALALLGVALALLRLPRAVRALALALLLPLLLWTPARPAPGRFALTVIDVGQGSAAWVQTAGHALLFDAGPRWGGDSDAGARVVLPLLRAAGVNHLDALVISHDDADHSGGGASVLASLPVAARWGSLPPRHALQPVQPCRAGLAWEWEGVRFEWLHPSGPGEAAARDNARSCVLRVQDAAGQALLLTADIEAAQERELLQRAAPLRATVLLLPHHGSKSSSSAEFLAAVQPQLAIAQAGFMNRHGHPAAPVRERLAVAGVPLLTSAECGAWQWLSSQPPGPQACWRLQRRRYWLTAAPAGALDDEPD